MSPQCTYISLLETVFCHSLYCRVCLYWYISACLGKKCVLGLTSNLLTIPGTRPHLSARNLADLQDTQNYETTAASTDTHNFLTYFISSLTLSFTFFLVILLQSMQAQHPSLLYYWSKFQISSFLKLNIKALLANMQISNSISKCC